MIDDRLASIRDYVGRHVCDAEFADDKDIFATSGVSSLFAIQLVMWVRRTFGIPVRPADLNLDHFRTVLDIHRFVESRLPFDLPAQRLSPAS
jgi:methoxymalonate biosynthesis acyl carrier protein